MRPDGVAFARAARLADASKQAPLTEMRVTLTVTENGRPVPQKSDGARFTLSGSTTASAAPEMTLKLTQGARYCLSLSAAAGAAGVGGGPAGAGAAARPLLESAQATVWTRCAQPPLPPASAAGLHEVLGLLLCCCSGGGGGAGGASSAADGGAGARAGEGAALVGRGAADSSGGGGAGDDADGPPWQGGAQVPVAEKTAGSAAGGGGSGGGGGGGGGGASKFELFWSPGADDCPVTPDGTRTEVAVEVVFANFGRCRLPLLCKVGPPTGGGGGGGGVSGGGSGGGGGSNGGSGSGGGGGGSPAAHHHLRPSGAVFHLLRSAMTGEVRILSRVPL